MSKSPTVRGPVSDRASGVLPCGQALEEQLRWRGTRPPNPPARGRYESAGGAGLGVGAVLILSWLLRTQPILPHSPRTTT